MKLTEVLKIDTSMKSVILVGTPEVTNQVDSDDKPYFTVQLKTPVMVGCSTDAGIEKVEATEVLVRESALGEDGWEFVNPKKPEEGFYRPGWVVDFSKGQEAVLYQETTIKKWARMEARKDK